MQGLKWLLIVGFLIAIPFVSGEILSDVFVIEFTHYPNGSADVSLIDVTRGSPLAIGEGKEYVLMLKNEDSVLYSRSISSHFVTYLEGLFPCEDVGYPDLEGELCLDGYEIELNSTEKFLRIPYFESADTLEFSYLGEVRTSIDLNEYLCSFDEACPVFCLDKGIDPDCPVEKEIDEAPMDIESGFQEIKSESGVPLWIYAVLGVVILFLFIIIFMSVRVERNA